MISVLLALAQAAVAAPPAATIPPAKEKRICIQDTEIGSRLRGKRICYTKPEYDEYLARAKSGLSERQRTGYFEGSKGACLKGTGC